MALEKRAQCAQSINNMDETTPLIVNADNSYSRLRAQFVLVVVVLYMGGFVAYINTQAQYIYRVLGEENGLFQNSSSNYSQNGSVCYSNKSDPHFIKVEMAQVMSSRWLLYATLAFGVPSVFSSVILGSYSDTAGRKFLFAISTSGLFLKCFVGTAVSYWNLPLYVLLIGNALDGISGAIVTFLIATFAFTADISKTGISRTFVLIVMEASFSLSSAVATIGTGYLIKATGYTLPFLVSTILSLLSLVFICALPGTRSFLDKVKPSGKYTKYIHRVFKIYTSTANNNPRTILIICLTNFLFAGMVATGRLGVETLYVFNEPLCWDSVTLGIWNGSSSGAQALGAMVLTRLAQFLFSDAVIGLLSVFTGVLSLILEGLAYNIVMMYLVSALRLLIVCSLSMLRVIMSKLTRPEDQGAVFASIACVEALTIVTGNVLFNAVYETTLALYRGIVFFVMAFILAVSSVLYIVIHFAVKRHVAKHGYASVIEGPSNIDEEIYQKDCDTIKSIQSEETSKIAQSKRPKD